MQMRRLGRSDIEVSALCLGSMTWGTQCTIADSHTQIDMARAHGVNFIDTAEMYPVYPIRKDTVGRTERIIGQWLEREGGRDRIVIATKHAGIGLKQVREGKGINAETVRLAIDGSLRRLNTDYIDLFQFHWPNRGSYMARKNWRYMPSSQNRDSTINDMRETLGAVQKEIEKGRIRAWGLCNETAWGSAQWLKLADEMSVPRPVSIQNEYSLMCRLFDTDLAELSHYESLCLLAYSPLAAGLLTGKYQNGAVPEGSRMSILQDLGGKKTVRAFRSVEAYLKLAAKYEIDPCHMAYAFCLSRSFISSALIGATSEEQLRHALLSRNQKLTPEILAEIDTVHRAHPMPF